MFVYTFLFLILVVLFLVIHFLFIDFTPEERNMAAISYTVETLFSNPKDFFEMYKYDLTMKNETDSIDLFADKNISDDVSERISSEGFVKNSVLPLIRGDVLMVAPEVNSLGIKVSASKSFAQNEIIYSNVECKSVSVFSKDDFNLIKNTSNLFNDVAVGDIFEASCLNEDCSNIVGDCILIKL